MNILGIETSCDDTSLCLAKGNGDKKFQIIETLTFSQIDIYKEWGGVVPEIASRNHLLKLKPLLTKLLSSHKLKIKDIDLIGVTTQPGLLGPLLTGINLAKSLSFMGKTKICPINHLHAHIQAIHIDQNVNYPYLGLILSGGHSLFVKVNNHKSVEVLASTIDDAAGEAFDKGGKILGLDYPSGPIIDKLSKEGDENFHTFPIGLSKQSSNPNMSFSGLKTSLKNFVEKGDKTLQSKLADICASYQKAIIKNVFTKFQIIHKRFPDLPIVLGGGVACNSKLRSIFKNQYQKVFFVSPKYCTDNAAMIANLAYLQREDALDFPQSLQFDAKNRFINKKDFTA